MRAFRIARAASGLRNHPSRLFVVSARLGLVAAVVASAAACSASPGDDGEDVASQEQALVGTPGVTYKQVCYGVSPEAPLTIPLGVDGYPAHPSSITAGPDGNMWILGAATNQIYSVTLQEAFSGPFTVPTNDAGLQTIASAGGRLWYTETTVNKIGSMSTSGQPGPDMATPTKNSAPWGLAAGPAGSVWFTESGLDAIGQMNLPNQAEEEYFLRGIPPNASDTLELRGITEGPDGNMWFIERTANKAGGEIGYVTTGYDGSGNVIPGATVGTLHEVGAAGSNPLNITSGPDGNLWFTTGSGIGRYTPGASAAVFFPVSPAPVNLVGLHAVASGTTAVIAFTDAGGNVNTMSSSGALGTAAAIPPTGLLDPSYVAIALDSENRAWVTGTDYSNTVDLVTMPFCTEVRSPPLQVPSL